jgi:hypothetical protein
MRLFSGSFTPTTGALEDDEDDNDDMTIVKPILVVRLRLRV